MLPPQAPQDPSITDVPVHRFTPLRARRQIAGGVAQTEASYALTNPPSPSWLVDDASPSPAVRIEGTHDTGRCKVPAPKGRDFACSEAAVAASGSPPHSPTNLIL